MSCKNYNITNRNSKPNCRSTQTNYSHSKTANKISTQTPKKQLQSLSTPKQKQTTSRQTDSPKASPPAVADHSTDASQTDSPKASPSALVEHSTDVSQTERPKASPPAVADHSTDARYTLSVNNRYTALADSTDLEPVTPAFPPPPSPPLLPSPSRNNRKAPLKQGKAAPNRRPIHAARQVARRNNTPRLLPSCTGQQLTGAPLHATLCNNTECPQTVTHFCWGTPS